MENHRSPSKKDQNDKDKKEQEAKIDDQLDQTFPASDPPSYSKPGNDLDKSKKHKK